MSDNKPFTRPSLDLDEIDVIPAASPEQLARTIAELSKPGTPMTIIKTDGTVTYFGR